MIQTDSQRNHKTTIQERFKAKCTYRHLVERNLKLRVFCPDGPRDLCRNDKRASVCSPHRIHLLLILPATAARSARAVLDKLDVVLPDLARILVETDLGERKVERLLDGAARCTGRVRHGVVTAAHKSKVAIPYCNSSLGHQRLSEDGRDAVELVLFRLHIEVGRPLIRLRMY